MDATAQNLHKPDTCSRVEETGGMWNVDASFMVKHAIRKHPVCHNMIMHAAAMVQSWTHVMIMATVALQPADCCQGDWGKHKLQDVP